MSAVVWTRSPSGIPGAITGQIGVVGADLVPWAEGPPGVLGFYLREAFQSQTHTEKIYNKSRSALIYYRN